MRMRDIITESTLDLDADSDAIYERFIEPTINVILDFSRLNGERLGIAIEKFTSQKFTLTDLIDNGIITNEKVIAANEQQPAIMRFVLSGAQYIPAEKNGLGTAIIEISLPKQALEIINDWHKGNDSLDTMANILFKPAMRRLFKNEFTSWKIKGSVAHELTHYVDDIFHNKHITKKVMTRTVSKGSLDKNPFDTHIEIEAQVASIRQMKRKFETIWDTFSYQDIFSMHPSLSIREELSKAARIRYDRLMVSRLNREGLLGKNMRDITQ